MLMKTHLVHPESTVPQVRRITGQYLAKCRLSKRDRALLAARIISGAVEIDQLTTKQIAALCGVSVTSVALVRNGSRKPDRAQQLVRIWDLAEPDQRAAMCAKCEPEVWLALERATELPAITAN
jgi:hypothetical protein